MCGAAGLCARSRRSCSALAPRLQRLPHARRGGVPRLLRVSATGGKPLRLARENASPDDRTAADLGDVVLAGRFVGFGETNCLAGCETVVTVVDVRARRPVR